MRSRPATLALRSPPMPTPPPSAPSIGVVPTHDGAVADVYEALRTLRRGLVPLVDGDDAGAEKIDQINGF